MLSNSDKRERYSVCSRVNVTDANGNIKKIKEAIPGEYLYTLDPSYFDIRLNPPAVQNFEKLYYQPCAICKRRYNHPECRCASSLYLSSFNLKW